MHNGLAEFSSSLHNWCLVHTSQLGSWSFFHQSLICAKKLEAPEKKLVFLKLGLIHITVISGAHLIFIHKFLILTLHKLKFKNHLILSLIGVYTLICDLSSPVLRAFIALCLKKVSKNHKFFIPLPIQILIVLLCCFILFPKLIHSKSLILSSLCTLVIHDDFFIAFNLHNKAFFKKYNSLCKASFIYLLSSPIIIQFHFLPSPLTILFQIILAPILFLIFIPVSFLTAIIPPLHGVTDQIYDFVFLVLEQVSSYSNISAYHYKLTTPALWSYLLFLLILTYCSNLLIKKHVSY
ncbi:MAG: hypothetical protein HOO06_04445 [Bdellovibrionaceae bacterium]|nr:hypothetical protein [Pseudobdellovibrionaceae bacterium]